VGERVSGAICGTDNNKEKNLLQKPEITSRKIRGNFLTISNYILGRKPLERREEKRTIIKSKRLKSGGKSNRNFTKNTPFQEASPGLKKEGRLIPKN